MRLKTVLPRAAGLFLGITLPLIVAYPLIMENVEVPGEGKEYKPGSAAEAVLKHLPQVAILGQKPGPAQTTEVFIQIPGVLNMQSVYVLGDGKTVISGFVLPELEAGGVPGGQLTLPTGQPTVDVSAKREGVDGMLSMLRGETQQSSGSSTKPEQQVSEGTARKPLPEPPAPASAATREADQSFEFAGQVRALTERPTPEPVVSAPGIALKSSPEATPARIAIPSQVEFTNLVKSSLNSDREIDGVRRVEGDDAQQAAYLNMVKALPSIDQGSGERSIYVFFDPNCPVCHSYYETLAPDIVSGSVTVHWIPVIVLPQEASGISVGSRMLELLATGESSEALSLLGQVMRVRGGTATVHEALMGKPTAYMDYVDDLARTTAVMAMAVAETPLTVYQNHQGQLVIESGIPATGFLANVGG